MQSYQALTKEELLKEKEKLEAEYKDWEKRGLRLNMARGKPCNEQLDLTMPMLDVITSQSNLMSEDNMDCRNYGILRGIKEARVLMAEMMEIDYEHVIVFGNASLNIMYDIISMSMIHGVMGNTPWCKLDKIKFLCPIPGYDRHFSITESFGIEMIPIPMDENGPDMDLIENYVKTDSSIKGIWCTPKYSNPTGISYSDEVVRRFSKLQPLAKDFRIFWDNAYIVHDLYEEKADKILNLIDLCEQENNADLVYEFCSTSKISFAGSGIAAFASSFENLKYIERKMSVQTIGHDKINQLRHVRYFKNLEGIHVQMKKQAQLLRPKFELVLQYLNEEIKSKEIASWKEPKGGYFICFEAMEGCAKRIVDLAGKIGVTLTPAGAAFPYGIDPKDSVIRIAPSYPSMEDLELAIQVFVLCIKFATVEKLLSAQ